MKNCSLAVPPNTKIQPQRSPGKDAQDVIAENINVLVHWLEDNDYSSFDHYDYWSTQFGIFSKRLFSKNKILALPFVTSVFLLDTYFPASRNLFAEKCRSAEAIPQIAIGYFQLYKITGNRRYLEKGCEMLTWLKNNAVKTPNGMGWGLHFNWQARKFVPTGTPCVTLTAHSTRAFLEGYHLTGIKEYLQTALMTADFVIHDLNKRQSGDQLSVSYTPIDRNYVINANSFAVGILSVANAEVNDPLKTDLIRKIINYIIAQQNADGSWYYSDKNDVPAKQNFIDCFHTCFVLEDLFYIWKQTEDSRILDSISKGFKFFADNFITPQYSVRYYHCYPCPTGILVDIRGCAEAIYCCALLSEIFPDALNTSLKITQWTKDNMQHKDGSYYFRIYRTHKHKTPYVRWGQAPIFKALAYLLSRLSNQRI